MKGPNSIFSEKELTGHYMPSPDWHKWKEDKTFQFSGQQYGKSTTRVLDWPQRLLRRFFKPPSGLIHLDYCQVVHFFKAQEFQFHSQIKLNSYCTVTGSTRKYCEPNWIVRKLRKMSKEVKTVQFFNWFILDWRNLKVTKFRQLWK